MKAEPRITRNTRTSTRLQTYKYTKHRKESDIQHTNTGITRIRTLSGNAGQSKIQNPKSKIERVLSSPCETLDRHTCIQRREVSAGHARRPHSCAQRH